MASKQPEIAPTVAFRHPGIEIPDQVIGDHRVGYMEQETKRERGEAPSLLPPYPDEPAPRTSLLERLRKRLERGQR